jgi:hypothetical protein
MEPTSAILAEKGRVLSIEELPALQKVLPHLAYEKPEHPFVPYPEASYFSADDVAYYLRTSETTCVFNYYYIGTFLTIFF